MPIEKNRLIYPFESPSFKNVKGCANKQLFSSQYQFDLSEIVDGEIMVATEFKNDINKTLNLNLEKLKNIRSKVIKSMQGVIKDLKEDIDLGIRDNLEQELSLILTRYHLSDKVEYSFVKIYVLEEELKKVKI